MEAVRRMMGKTDCPKESGSSDSREAQEQVQVEEGTKEQREAEGAVKESMMNMYALPLP